MRKSAPYIRVALNRNMLHTSTAMKRKRNEQEYVEQTGATVMRDLSLIRAASKRPKRKILNSSLKRMWATQHWLTNWKYHSAYIHASHFAFLLWYLSNPHGVHTENIDFVIFLSFFCFVCWLGFSLGRSCLPWRILLENSPPVKCTTVLPELLKLI